MKVLLVSFYFPPAGGGGVQRPLKLAQYLPALGIETHVLAPDDPQWIHRDEALRVPTQAWVHRARYLGPVGRKPAEELHGKEGLARLATQTRLLGRRALVPDENVSWNLTAIPAAIRLVRKHEIDVVITTSPPNSIHLVGAAVKRATGARWVADLRDSVVAHAHRRSESRAVRAKEKVDVGVAKLVARSADAVVCVSDFIADEVRTLEPRGRVLTIANGSDFDDFDGLAYTPGPRMRITHAGSFFGKRDPRPFLQALARLRARHRGPLPRGLPQLRPRVGRRARPRRPARADSYAPRATSLALQRDSDALLLLIPDAGGRGKGVLSGKVFEYLAAERPILAAVPPDGAAAELIRETGAGVVAAPDDVDALRAALRRARRPLHERRAPRRAAVAEVAAVGRPLDESGGDGRAVEVAPMSRRQPFVDFFFFATIATVTFEKIHWSVGSDLALSDVLTALFLIAFALRRLEHLDGRFTRSAAITFAFFLAFLAVYLLGFFNLETAGALAQWAKGMVKFLLHFLFLFAAVALVARRGERYFWWALGVFCGGIAANALYGVLQLGVAQTTGGNLDATVLSPITGGASQINIYGAVQGASVYRPNALTGDPNHLAIELLVPLLVLLPIYLRLERGNRFRVPLMVTLMILLVIELATFSRSGLLGLFFGLLVLAVPYRHLFLRPGSSRRSAPSS